jgi:hypothetical protein
MNEATHNTKHWNEDVHLLANAINQTVGKNSQSPEVLMFGFSNERANDVLKLQQTPKTEAEHVTMVQTTLKSLFDQAEKFRAKTKATNEAFANRSRKTRTFEVGSVVYYQDKLVKTSSGLRCKFTGPFLVTHISDHLNTAQIEEIGAEKKEPRKAHFTLLKPVTELHTSTCLNSGWDEELRAAFPKADELETEV